MSLTLSVASYDLLDSPDLPYVPSLVLYSRLHWSSVNGKFDAIQMLPKLDDSGADVALRFTFPRDSLQRRDLLALSLFPE